jgi:two-component system, sensor histidine kinase and response regulator
MKETVLIVDDTPTNLQVLVRLLSDRGFITLVAEDGASAMELTLREKPDIILLDVMMPMVNGFETCRHLKERSETHDIPVIFMTARSELTDKMKGFEVGAVDYITKPFQKEEVIARVTTQLTLARQKRDLKSLAEQRGRFMRIAAHDLRNPLTVINAWSEIGSTSDDLSKMQKAFHSINTAAQLMEAIIDDFLALHIVQSQARDSLGSFDLKLVIEQVLEQQSFAAQSKQITLSSHLPTEPITPIGNLSHTHQILTNFVTNAVKYSPPQTQTVVSARLLGDQWRVEVRDQGPGIAPAERRRLFVEFAKISNKPTGGETSTRLGLAIVKALAEAQRGSVGAEFPPEGGSVFWLEIPALAKV